MELPGDRYDLVVVGSGVAGLYGALTVAHRARVLLVTKDELEESNTRYAQGGIAVALREGDTPALHVRDTVAAGDGLCDSASVDLLTREAPSRILDLVGRGVDFDRENGDLAWTLEAAHSRPRVLHAGGDATGWSIESTLARLVRESPVEILERAMCVDLNLEQGHVQGIDLLLETGERISVDSRAVLLATGGAGQLFGRTTNPAVATGDGVALAFRAGAEVMDPEFFQFHPTALAIPGRPAFLISEAVRGEGGILRDSAGDAFMRRYHPDAELAPRDVVARAIHQQMQTTNADHVLLDVTHLDPMLVERRFPAIVAYCRRAGVDPLLEPIPVAPAAHYWMGGIRTDLDGRTSISGLFACGEAACTGVHGANRLASNSLLEGLVFGARAAEAAVEGISWSRLEPARIDAPGPASRDRSPDRHRLGQGMWRDASLVRSQRSLAQAAGALDSIDGRATDARARYEARNLAQIAAIVLAAAAFREESRGAHFRSDFPETRPEWRAHTVVSRDGIGTAPLTAIEEPVGV